jgi:hypothetical protein
MRGYVNTLMAENVALPKPDGYRFICRRDGDGARVLPAWQRLLRLGATPPRLATTGTDIPALRRLLDHLNLFNGAGAEQK